ncbi:MAG TPA: hypothetical protein VFO24_10480 [Usitatibacter sp.]|nr:hypothetical protein [Usitatibacter sp.]
MLFDLRGRGRRRTVQITYIGLAVLMGGGLVLFGVGGGFGGTGILNAVNGNEGSNSASFSSQIKKYEKLVRNDPTSVSAWEQLTTAQLHEAGGEAYVVGGKPTAKGHELFSATARSWERYLALNPPKPSLALAKEMLRIFSAEGLNQPASAVQALQIIVAAEPHNASFYAALAQYAYLAHNTRVGDLASARALALIPAGAERNRVKTELETAKKNPGGGETLTGHTNGKAFTVKKAPNGAYTGAVPSTPPPATGTK